MLANNDRLYSEGKYPVLSLRRTIAAIDSRLQLDGVTNEERNDLEKLAKDLRVFLTRLPDHGSYSKTHHSPSGSPTELRVNFTHSSLSSTGISGSTVSTNEVRHLKLSRQMTYDIVQTSSAYTTSPYQSDSVNQTGKQRASHTSSQSVGTATTSTLPI
ncbi:hypothetical protein Q1695_009357 [Nippostrongylus brasiliensis]|nr:hypothetical protein Q1695_009357 [Nippostrongylus brasiliensis]